MDSDADVGQDWRWLSANLAEIEVKLFALLFHRYRLLL